MRGKKQPPAGEMEMTRQLPAGTSNAELEAANLTHQIEAQMAEHDAEQQRADLAALASIKMPVVRTKKTEVLAKQLRDGANKDAAPAGQVLQTWIRERN
jgi:superfamily I DNA and RNA helicase